MFYGWKPYVPAAERKRKAERALAKLRKKGVTPSGVVIDRPLIAQTFWGKAWCDNLERYSDYENRLPRGRTYLRNGCVVDLRIAPGEVTALVSGSSLYTVKAQFAHVTKSRWNSLCADCAGAIDSLVELLQGRFAKGVMERICREGVGLFPTPEEIAFSCSCPDWADMCKHVAAVLYGVGVRLDHSPELLFVLRQVNQNDLIAKAGQDVALAAKGTATARRLEDSDGLAEMFGIELAATDQEPEQAKKRPASTKVSPTAAKKAGRKQSPAKKSGGKKGKSTLTGKAANAARPSRRAASRS
jgi:uncharacterized Zn finger protein